MKKILMSFVVIFMILAVGLLGYMFTSISSDSKNTSNSNNLSSNNTNSRNNNIFNVSGSKLVNTQTLSLDDITSISIWYSSFDVMLYASNTNELIIKEYMNFIPTDNELAQITKNNHSLNIKSGKKDNNFGTSLIPGSNKVEIYLPADYNGILAIATTSGNISSDLVFNLEQFNAACTSGTIIFNEIKATDINIATTSGNIEVDKADGNRNIASSSGEIKLYNGSGDTHASTTSGNIIIENASGKITTSASSGNIKVNGLSGGGELSTTSGNITLILSDDLNSLTYNLDLTASSGNITLKIPSNLSFNFNAKTTSGDIRTSFDNDLAYNKDGNNTTGTVGSKPSMDIEIVATSGNVHVD